jgi:Mg-chelatase subunit ChlD
MMFTDPIWLLLFFPLLALLLWWPAYSRLLFATRAAMLALIVLAMAGMSLKLHNGDGVVVMIADRSLSMPADYARQQDEAFNIFWKSIPAGNRLGIVSFAESATVEKLPEAPAFDGFKAEYNRNQSNLKNALETAVSLIPPDTPGRIVLFSDGSWTGLNPSEVFALCAVRGIPVDYRNQARSQVHDLAISDIQAPSAVPSGEFFTAGVIINSPTAMTAEYALSRNRQQLAAGKLQLRTGINQFYFKDMASSPQALSYTFSIKQTAGSDPRPENNRANFNVKIIGQRPVLLVTGTRYSGLGKVLKQGGINVHVKLPHELEFSIAELSAYCGIIIENVPASSIGHSGMQIIADMVKNGSLGLMTTGGKNAYAIGGYFKSPLDEVMPVSMELKREHRKLSMAIVVTLDRSGSMAAPIGNGRTKIDLANLATVEVLNMLTPNDEFGVIAVDSMDHEVVPLLSAEEAKAKEGKILAIQSMGGGIFIYKALVSAAQMLSQSKSGTRHIVLFADAADSEEPGEYKALLDKCVKAGVSVSVIGLGSQSDCDAQLLEDIARRGGGQCFFTTNAGELPRLFAQDTFIVSRNTFVDTATKVNLTGLFKMISRKKIDVGFVVGGYNFCSLKPGAQAGAVSDDEHKSPVIAFWYTGNGRAMSYAGEADGEFSGPFAKWPQAGNMLTAMVLWTSGYGGQKLPDNMMLEQEMDRGVHRIRLHLDPERSHDPFSKQPEIVTLSGNPGQSPVTARAVMQWESPDSLVLEVPLNGSETSLSTVFIDRQPPLVLTPVTLPYSPEFRPADTDSPRYSMEHLCRMTGGKERLDLVGIWRELPTQYRLRNIGKWLLLAAVLLLLLEVLERRTGLPAKLLARRRHDDKLNSVAGKVQSPMPEPERKPESGISASKPPEKQKKMKKVDAQAEKPHSMADAMNQVKKNTRGK